MTFWLKIAVLIFCLFPAGQLAYRAYNGDLGVNPIETITGADLFAGESQRHSATAHHRME
jgi:hypothetical protein